MEAMEAIKNKKWFKVIFAVEDANPNGDPMNDNRPRMLHEFGMATGDSIRRKIRNRLMSYGESVYVIPEDRNIPGYSWYDGYESLRERLNAKVDMSSGEKNKIRKEACEAFIDIRGFGTLFAFSGEKKGKGINISVRGPVSVSDAKSISPIEVNQVEIVKSVDSENINDKVARRGKRFVVPFGLYAFNGTIYPDVAATTGFSEKDAQLLKRSLCTLFEGDYSVSRPTGSMYPVKVVWWEKECDELDGPNDLQVYNSFKVELKEGIVVPKSPWDYEYHIKPDAIPGVKTEIINVMAP